MANIDDWVKQMQDAERAGDDLTAQNLRYTISLHSDRVLPDRLAPEQHQSAPQNTQAQRVTAPNARENIAVIRRNTTITAWVALVALITGVIALAQINGRLAASLERSDFAREGVFWSAFGISLLIPGLATVLAALVLWIWPKN